MLSRPEIYDNTIPFTHFTSLIHAIASVEPVSRHASSSRKPAPDGPSRQQRLLHRWINNIKDQHPAGSDSPLPPGTVTAFFRLLFPEEGSRRRYDVQELKLGDAVAEYLGARPGRFRSWNVATEGVTASGCLGIEVQRYLKKRGYGRAREAELTVGRVEQLLDEMAALSMWSAVEVRFHRRRTFKQILKDLLDPLEAGDVAIMLQIILRDLSPILYPPPSVQGDRVLTHFTSLAYDQVTVLDAMHGWHSDMPRLYRVIANIDTVAGHVDSSLRSGCNIPSPQPAFGIPITIPKTERPGTCSNSCKFLSTLVAAETKYDGERMQIHIDLSLPRHSQIRIFSKNGRDSTADRRLVHSAIRASLGIELDLFDLQREPRLAERLRSSFPREPPSFTRLVVEGELVPYEEASGTIEEFWKLGAAKVGLNELPLQELASQADSYETGATISPRRKQCRPADAPTLHLKVVWFDILMIDDEALLLSPYQERRARLASLVTEIQGYSMLAESITINFQCADGLPQLRSHFAHIIAMRAEGLMLKPLDSSYNDTTSGMRWIKLKKDFIPGAGDTLDFNIIGASWQKRRGRALLVPPSMFTHFFIGLRDDSLGPRASSKPHYHILFSTCYGLSREQLYQLVTSIQTASPLPFSFDDSRRPAEQPRDAIREAKGGKSSFKVYESSAMSYTFSLADHLATFAVKPSDMFRVPRVFELNGAGFQKDRSSPYYELRWPRILKTDRLDGDPIDLASLQSTADKAMKLATNGNIDFDRLFRCDFETDEDKLKRETKEWLAKLEASDGISTLVTGGFFHPDGYAATTPSAVATTVDFSCRHSLALSPLRRHQTDPSPSASNPMVVHVSSSLDLPKDSPPRELKRPRLSLPFAPTSDNIAHLHPLESSSSALLKLKRENRRRSSLPSRTPSLPQTLSAFDASHSTLNLSTNLDPIDPTTHYAWSFFPTVNEPDIKLPSHPHLDRVNFLCSPLDVLWAAGWLPHGYDKPHGGQKKKGVVFVDGEKALEWLREHRGVRAGCGERVRIVDLTAMDTCSDWDFTGDLDVF